MSRLMDPYEVQAKQTLYKGIWFRSRLEARWAVFFDAVGIRWTYECERYRCFCYDDEKPLTYLPDFYLPDYDVYVEVKGTDKQLFKTDAASRIAHAIDFAATPVSNGLILLGNIPYSPRLRPVSYFYGSFLFHHEGVILGRFNVVWDGERVDIEFDRTVYDVIDCLEDTLPEGTTVELGFHEAFGSKTILDRGLDLARQARFDFDDSVERMRQDGRTVIGSR